MKKEIINLFYESSLQFNSPQFWESVGKGIELLFEQKEKYSSKQDLLEDFLNTKKLILETNDSIVCEDFLDELEAIIVKAYPMPDFWNDQLDDFVHHINFENMFPRKTSY